MNNCFKKSSYFVYGVRASKLTPTLSGSYIVYAVGTDSWVQLSFSQFQVSQKIDFKAIWTHESSPTAWELIDRQNWSDYSWDLELFRSIWAAMIILFSKPHLKMAS